LDYPPAPACVGARSFIFFESDTISASLRLLIGEFDKKQHYPFQVAGELEPTLWCGLRVASASAVFSVSCRPAKPL